MLMEFAVTETPANIAVFANKDTYFIRFLNSPEFNLFQETPALDLPPITKQLSFTQVTFTFVFKLQEVHFSQGNQTNIF